MTARIQQCFVRLADEPASDGPVFSFSGPGFARDDGGRLCFSC
jgi:hypothetical protein